MWSTLTGQLAFCGALSGQTHTMASPVSRSLPNFVFVAIDSYTTASVFDAEALRSSPQFDLELAEEIDEDCFDNFR